MRTGVHLRSVQAWESGVSFPAAERLQALITSLLAAGGFAIGREQAEAETLWSAADRESSRQRPPFDAGWFAEVLATRDVGATVEKVEATPPDGGVNGAHGTGGGNGASGSGRARAQDWGMHLTHLASLDGGPNWTRSAGGSCVTGLDSWYSAGWAA